MHPNLAPHLHPKCKEQIQALNNCHESHPFKKFIGICNAVRKELDKCLTEEYHELRLANRMKKKTVSEGNKE